MTKKKISSSKKSKESKVTKTTKKDENLGKAELDIIHKSFEMVQKLKDEVQTMKKAKDKIKTNVKNIEAKVAKHEKPKHSEEIHHTILHNLKDEIAKDFAPVLKKFNLKDVKTEILKEISKVIELESKKLKSEIDSLNSKNKKDFTKKLSDLEIKVLQSLNENERIRQKLKTNSTHINFSKEIEERMHDIVSRANEKYFTMLDANTLDLDELKKHSGLLEKRIENLKSALKQNISKEGVSLSSIESKVIKLENDNKSIKSLLEKYENDLYSKNKTQATQIEKKVKSILEDANKKLTTIEKEKKAQEKFIVDKINEVIDYVGVVEKKIQTIEKSDMSSLEKNLLETLNSKAQEIELQTKDFLTKTRKELWTDYKQFMALKEEILPLYEQFKIDFKVFEESKNKVAKELKKDIQKEIEELSKSATKSTELTEKNLKKLNTNIQDFESKFQIQTQKQVEEFKAQLKQELQASTIDAVTDMKKNRDLTITDIDSHKKDTFDRIEKKFHEINTKYTKQFDALTKALQESKDETQKVEKLFNLEKDGQQKFLVEKFNSIIDELNSKNVEQIEIVRKEASKDFDKIIESKVLELLGDFKKEKDLLNKEFMSYKKDIEKLYTKSLKELDKKINLFKEDKSQINSFIEDSKSQIASQIASSNEYLTKINLENKEDKRSFSEDIEAKFLTVKDQYDTIFNEHLKTFETELKSKEDDYMIKLEAVHKDKDEVVKELEGFKTEITTLTKEYIAKLDDEFQKIKALEANFESEKDSFTTQIGEVYEQRKQGLKAHSQELEEKLTQQIIAQKETFESNENSFKDLFKEKIYNLHEALDKRIEKLQKNFVDKNLKYVTDKLDSEMQVFKSYEQRLTSKEEELSKKQDILNSQQESFGADFEATKENLHAKVEERLVTLEKQFNKRFLDYDTSFGNFKAVVIDEVEDFMKEIQEVINSRLDKANNTASKLTFTQSEMEKSFAEFSTMKQGYEAELNELRNKVADTTAKVELFSEVSTYGLNDHVQYMSEYENQLIGLIKNLKTKGISNDNIQAALINKGHPMFYVTMILSNFDKIHN